MKYLTKEWYELCQRTGLHFDMRAHKGVNSYDEALYLKLYKRKEKEFVKLQREVYDVDPRFMLEHDGAILIPADKFVNDEVIDEEDKVIYHMPEEEKEHIQKLIEEYDTRPPFDEQKCREDFRNIQEMRIKEAVHMLPHVLYQQIADVRVFSLGYCTKEILKQLKAISKENAKKMDRTLKEYFKAQQKEDIPQIISERFGFHDCMVTELTVGKHDVVMRIDTSGGFTNYNIITFATAEIIRQDENIVGSTWIYNELYRTGNGYEAHVLFWAGDGLKEIIIQCNDIIIEETER